jgi:hypothetical protein
MADGQLATTVTSRADPLPTVRLGVELSRRSEEPRLTYADGTRLSAEPALSLVSHLSLGQVGGFRTSVGGGGIVTSVAMARPVVGAARSR